MLKLKQWIRDWLKSDEPIKHPHEGLVCEDNFLDQDKAINFTLWIANGGKVIQTRRYDRVKDRRLTTLYVISHDAILGSEIDKILTLESLRS